MTHSNVPFISNSTTITVRSLSAGPASRGPVSSAPSFSSSASSASVSISLLVNEMLVYLRELQASSRISLQSPFSQSPKGSLIRVFSRIRDIVTEGQSSITEKYRWSAHWNEDDSALYRAMVKALERMVISRRGDAADAHLITLLKAKCPRTVRRVVE